MKSPTITERICGLLDLASADYQLIAHPPVSSSVEAAEVRGTPLEMGVKSILFKINKDFALFAMSAAAALHAAKIRKGLKVQRTRFASREELVELTGLQPGGVPPFGEPVLPFPLYLDPSALARDEVVFTAGSRTTSIRMATEDYRRVVAAQVFPFVR